MSRRLSGPLALSALVAILPTPQASAQTIVSGTITEDTIWTAEAGPYILVGDVFIGAVGTGTTLTIEPGVEIRGSAGSSLVVNGTLSAIGDQEGRITFTSDSGTRDWDGLSFDIVSASPPPQHELHHVTVEKATTAIRLGYGDLEMVDNVFDGNGKALVLDNPQDPAVIENNVFMNNEVAITGRSMGFVGIYSNDFWNNEVNLLPKPQKPYSCLPDGLWSIHRNDILRGPANAGHFSNDVRTPPGSAASEYGVDATDNWWGTTEERSIEGRLTEYFNCCPPAAQKRIYWRPVSDAAHTPWQPPGEIPDPEPGFGTHADPGSVSTIERPGHFDCLDRSELRAIEGRLYRILASHPVKLSLGRKYGRGACRWWSARKEVFVERFCDDPIRFRPRTIEDAESPNASWTYRLPRRLRAGRYIAISATGSEPIHLGRNEVRFRLF